MVPPDPPALSARDPPLPCVGHGEGGVGVSAFAREGRGREGGRRKPPFSPQPVPESRGQSITGTGLGDQGICPGDSGTSPGVPGLGFLGPVLGGAVVSRALVFFRSPLGVDAFWKPGYSFGPSRNTVRSLRRVPRHSNFGELGAGPGSRGSRNRSRVFRE